ncbi:hypothetical protein N7488_001412 [Penicillium malachiteum]|nr:hypothetical protein N7488_001412 [Penicillium malachiteum]
MSQHCHSMVLSFLGITEHRGLALSVLSFCDRGGFHENFRTIGAESYEREQLWPWRVSWTSGQSA